MNSLIFLVLLWPVVKAQETHQGTVHCTYATEDCKKLACSNNKLCAASLRIDALSHYDGATHYCCNEADVTDIEQKCQPEHINEAVCVLKDLAENLDQIVPYIEMNRPPGENIKTNYTQNQSVEFTCCGNNQKICAESNICCDHGSDCGVEPSPPHKKCCKPIIPNPKEDKKPSCCTHGTGLLGCKAKKYCCMEDYQGENKECVAASKCHWWNDYRIILLLFIILAVTVFIVYVSFCRSRRPQPRGPALLPATTPWPNAGDNASISGSA